MLIHCCTDVFTTPLHKNEHSTDHRKHRSFVVACILFCGGVFTKPLPSNELFQLSGVMSQYFKLMCENQVFFSTFTNYMSVSVFCRQNTRPTDDMTTEVKVDEGEPATGTGTHHEARRGSRELPPFRASNTWRLMSGPKRVITVIDEASV
jgi:hypothetical protein